MSKTRDVLRLKLQVRHSHQQTAAALDISKGVITKYLTLASAAGLDWPQVQGLDDTALHNRRQLATEKKGPKRFGPFFLSIIRVARAQGRPGRR